MQTTEMGTLIGLVKNWKEEMTSTKEHVTLQGRLSGQGHEADCTVSAIKVTLPGGPSAYARYSVSTVSRVLPEGDYELLLSTGDKIPVRYYGGEWLSRGL